MWNLLMLYEYLLESPATKDRMWRSQPGHKFLCIKCVVLFSLWQESILKFLAKHSLLPHVTIYGMNPDHTIHSQTVKADAIVNFLVCFEMMLFAQWHCYAYPWNEDWRPADGNYEQGSRKCCSLLRLIDDMFY